LRGERLAGNGARGTSDVGHAQLPGQLEDFHIAGGEAGSRRRVRLQVVPGGSQCGQHQTGPLQLTLESGDLLVGERFREASAIDRDLETGKAFLTRELQVRRRVPAIDPQLGAPGRPLRSLRLSRCQGASETTDELPSVDLHGPLKIPNAGFDHHRGYEILAT
jgi:hypothetical protein